MASTRASSSIRRVPFADLAGMHQSLRPGLDAVWDSAVSTSAYIGGFAVDRFEREWAVQCQRRHCVGVANGTDAITLALRGFGIGPGDEVIVPTNTFIASAEGIVHSGAKPVFIDVDPLSRLVDVAHVSAAVTPKTAAVLVVHLYGHMPDMDALAAFCAGRGLALIEDAAQAHGSAWRGRPAGSFGQAATFSFYPGKNLGAFGDGGAVVLDDEGVAAGIRSIANHGRSDRDRSVHPVVGVNSRLDAIQAGVLSVKLGMLDEWTERRQRVAAVYERTLADLSPPLAATLVRPIDGCASGWHLLVVEVDDRAAVMRRLKRSGIDTAIHYPVPCHQQAAFNVVSRALPTAEAQASRILSLPMFPHLGSDDVAYVCRSLVDAVRGAGQ